MEGVTTAIVAFLFVCVVFPKLVKNKAQYYAAFGAIILVILLAGLEAVITSGAFHALATFVIAVSQATAMILLILCAGGLTWHEFTGEITEAIEVIRRGETQKEVIIPLSGEVPIATKTDAPVSSPPPAVRIVEPGSPESRE
jgi:hypothetical protein